MQFYDFIYRDSVVHKLDPRTKILWVLMLTFIVFMTDNKAVILGILIFVILTIFIAKLPVKSVWESSKVFIIGLTISYILLFSLLLWDWKKGLIDGTMFSAKFLIIILSTIVFSMSTSPRSLISALVKIKIPYEIAFMLTIAIRFVPVITRELNMVMDAQKARAFKIKISLLHPFEMAKSFIPILIPTLLILFKKAFDLSISIESRAFRTNAKRTYPPGIKLKTMDYISLIVMIVIFWFVTK